MTAEFVSGLAKFFRFEFQTATGLRSRAAARGELLSFSSPSTLRGRRNAERRTLVTAAAYLPDCRKTEAHGNACSALRRGVLRPWSVLPGTWQPSAISRRTPVPVQPGYWQSPVVGPDGNPGPPEPVLARHNLRRRISLQGCPFRPALALSHFRIASRSAPSLDRTRNIYSKVGIDQ
jgi:hypothetical protein